MPSFFWIYIASRDGGAVEYNAAESVSYTVPFTSSLKANIAQSPKLNGWDILLEEQHPVRNPNP